MSFPAVMNVEKDEEVVLGLVSNHIAGTGRYKQLAKKKLMALMNGHIL